MSEKPVYRIQRASLADVRSMASVLNSAFKPLTQYKSVSRSDLQYYIMLIESL